MFEILIEGTGKEKIASADDAAKKNRPYVYKKKK